MVSISPMGTWISSVVDALKALVASHSWLFQRLRRKKPLTLESPALRHKAIVHAKSAQFSGPKSVPHIFTTASRSLNVEWNLCDLVDPARRVDVVSDHKLLRKRMKGLFVDKNTQLHVHGDTRTLAQNELEIMCYFANYCELFKHPLHENIVHLLGYYCVNERLHQIIEFCELGSLMNAYIQSPQDALGLTSSPTEREIRHVMFQICSGVHFLHGHGVVHGNLGLENVFVTSENLLKIGDFEHAMFVGSENQLQPVSKLPSPPLQTYLAPEINVSKPGEVLDLQKADVWSLGIMFILLLTKKPLFDAARPTDHGFQMFCRVGLRSYLKVMYLEQSAICPLSGELVEFAEGLLQLNPSMRFTVREALETKWLKRNACSARL